MTRPRKPEASIPKFIEAQDKPAKAPKEDMASNVLGYCVARANLDLSLLTPAERKTFLRLIRKSIPKEGTSENVSTN